MKSLLKPANIIVSSIVACALLFFIDQIIQAHYIIKTTSKIILFIGIPLFFLMKEKKGFGYFVLGEKKKPSFRISLLFGAGCFVVVLTAYFLFAQFIDLENIRQQLQSTVQVTAANFIFVALYLTFVNSFLEEIFFRGYIFLGLYEWNKWIAYVFSSLLFTLYHIGIFVLWFEYWISGIALLGLFIGGLLFNWVNSFSKNILNSWFVHIGADAAIVLVGFYMFGFF